MNLIKIEGNDQNKLALIVEDSPTQIEVLTALLVDEGYDVVSANDGASGVTMFVEHQPDLVLMDINMPVMNGFDAARKIKDLSKHKLTPLLFVTNLASEKAFVKSIEAGGDECLARPFSPEVFRAKVTALQRINLAYQKIHQLQQSQVKDSEIAEQLLSKVIESRNYGLERIGMLKKPAEVFSGDIQLTALCPNGNINVLLGDFTGHGLRSSIGALPLAETFRSMSHKGFSLLEIVHQVNTLLYELLPSDLFLAGCFATISSHEKTVTVFNAGLPEAYLLSECGSIKKRFESLHPPMGVLPQLIKDASNVVKSALPSDHLVLISDGIIEARNRVGQMYGEKRLEQTISIGIKKGKLTEKLLNSVNLFCQETEQEDDFSLIDVPCGDWLRPILKPEDVQSNQSSTIALETLPDWQWQLTLRNERLANVNPIPVVMNQIQELEGKSEQWLSFSTILTELFINALDHGVLQLNSSIKSSAEGYSKYYKERESRLSKLQAGIIDIQISSYTVNNGGKIVLTIKDSGNGFDSLKFFQSKKSKTLSGRGIHLVSELCHSLEYKENGTLVEATYLWH